MHDAEIAIKQGEGPGTPQQYGRTPWLSVATGVIEKAS